MPAGSSLRAVVSVRSVEEISCGLQLGLRCVLEIDGAWKPGCVAETLTLLQRQALVALRVSYA